MPNVSPARFLPKTSWVRNSHIGRMSGCLINDPNLWHINKRSVSIGIAVGLFSACMPIPGQMILAVMLAIVLRGNLALAMAATWVSNPVTYAPIFYFAYKLGSWVLQTPELGFQVEFSMAWLQEGLLEMYRPLLTGCLILGISVGSIAHTLIYSGWRLMIRRRWQKRLNLRQLRDSEKSPQTC